MLIWAGRTVLHIAFDGYAGTNRGTELKLHLDNAGRVPVRNICAWLLSDGKRVSHTSHPLLKQSDSAVNLRLLLPDVNARQTEQLLGGLAVGVTWKGRWWRRPVGLRYAEQRTTA